MKALFALLVAASSIRGAAAQQVDTTLWTRLHYRFVGPEGNRAIAAVGEPGNPLVAYIGAASGGVWKTEDGGVHWRAVFDSEPAQAIGALAIAPSAHNVLWAGTGETFFIRSTTALGNGVYRSTDGGRSWLHLGLEGTGRIARIVIHPADPDVVLVCALGRAYGPAQDRGVYRTPDGGKTWPRVLFVDANDRGTTWRLVSRDHSMAERAPYYVRFAVAPDDAERLYFVSVRFSMSRDGGRTLARSGFQGGGDNHDIWIDPLNPDRFMIAHDGGASITLNRGKTFARVVLPIAQMHHVHPDLPARRLTPRPPARQRGQPRRARHDRRRCELEDDQPRSHPQRHDAPAELGRRHYRQPDDLRRRHAVRARRVAPAGGRDLGGLERRAGTRDA